MGDQIIPNRLKQTLNSSPILQLLGAGGQPQPEMPAPMPEPTVSPEADYFGQQPSTAFRDAEAAGTPMSADAAGVPPGQLATPKLPPPIVARPPVSGRPVAPRAKAYRDAISGIESGGRYNAIGPAVKRKDGSVDRAYGKYQIMGANIGPWTKAALGRAMTPGEFLRDYDAQDAVFDHVFGGYVKRFGEKNAAQAWLGGTGSIGKLGRKDVLGTSVGSYGDRFMQALGNAPAGTAADPSGVDLSDPATVTARYNSKLFGGDDITPGQGEELQKQRLTADAGGGGSSSGGGMQASSGEMSQTGPAQDDAEAFLQGPLSELQGRRQQLAARRQERRQQVKERSQFRRRQA